MKRTPVVFFCLAACCSMTYAGPTSLSDGKATIEAAAPIAAEQFSWTGFYLGARLGYGWHDGDVESHLLPDNVFRIDPSAEPNDAEGFVGGGEFGYNWQFQRFVVGAEADFSGASVSGDSNPTIGFPPSNLTGHQPRSLDVNWFGTVRGRVGFALTPRLLIYGTGGLAYANVDETVGAIAVVANYVNTRSSTDFGWTAGGGVEYAIFRNWTMKAEYLHSNLGDHTMTAESDVARSVFRVKYRWDAELNSVVLGVNYKF